MEATWVSINRQMDEEIVIYKNVMLLSHKKNKILPFATMWMSPETITFSKVGQRKTNTIYHLYV